MKDRKFFLLAIALENATQEQLNTLISEINTLVAKYSSGGQITDPVALNKAISKLIDSFYNVFVENLYESTKAVGQLQASIAVATIVPLLAKAGLYNEAIALYKEVQAYADAVAKRLMTNGWAGSTLDYTIKTLKAGTQKTVQNIIVNGVENGKGAVEIAREIRQYVKPVDDITKIRPYDEYRKRFGRPKSFTPKGVPAGSVQYNALRIARTETAHIYREATLDFYDDKEYVKGFSWNLSNRHPVTDECDANSKRVYKTRDDIPRQHPNCLCSIEAIPMTQRELAALRKEKYATVATAEKTKQLVGV